MRQVPAWPAYCHSHPSATLSENPLIAIRPPTQKVPRRGTVVLPGMNPRPTAPRLPTTPRQATGHCMPTAATPSKVQKSGPVTCRTLMGTSSFTWTLKTDGRELSDPRSPALSSPLSFDSMIWKTTKPNLLSPKVPLAHQVKREVCTHWAK